MIIFIKQLVILLYHFCRRQARKLVIAASIEASDCCGYPSHRHDGPVRFAKRFNQGLERFLLLGLCRIQAHAGHLRVAVDAPGDDSISAFLLRLPIIRVMHP